MVKIDQKVISAIEKIRRYVEAVGVEQFPLESVRALIDITIGGGFWEGISDKYNVVFGKTVDLYIAGFEKAVENKDADQVLYLLELFEYQYRSMITAISDEERFARERPYKKQIIQIGEAYARMQYRLHEERQKGMVSSNVKLMSGKGCVYTCVLGEEVLYQPDNFDSQIEYLCFTDNKEKWGTKDGAWKYCELENKDGLDEKKLRMKCCILAHELLKDYDYSIWVDREYKVAGEIKLFCEVYGNGNSLLSFPQSSKDCMYEDMLYTDMGSDDRNIEMRKKIHAHKKEGYPENNGLIDSRIMVRNHRDPMLCQVMEQWWEKSLQEESIEATYFNYIAWKNKFAFSICDLFIYFNPYFVNMDVDLDTHEEL